MSDKKSVLIPDYIRKTSRILQVSSKYLATKYAVKLFSTPIKFRMPRNEQFYVDQSETSSLEVPAIGKTLNVYKYGQGPKKALLIHGWSGRGTQLAHFAKAIEKEYTVYSFDGPSHGKSTGKTTNMREFIYSIEALDAAYGPFDLGIGHSLGGMALINANAMGVPFEKIVSIGAGDTITEIAQDFVAKIELKPLYGPRLKSHFDKKFKQDVDDFSSHKAAKNVKIPALIVHDKQDIEVSVSCAETIRQNLEQGSLLITEGLGHTKILRNKELIAQVKTFIDA